MDLVTLALAKKYTDEHGSGARNFPSSWPINGTCQDFLEAVAQDANATVGKTYQGGIAFSDLSADLGLSNAEAEVEIISSTLGTNNKIIRLNVYSATNEPYSWARIYWWHGSYGEMKPWSITARAADQYTTPVATGTVNASTGACTFTSWSLSRGMYLVNTYGTVGGNNTSYTYYFAYGGYQDYITYSCDSHGTVISALNGSLTMSKVTGTGNLFDSDGTIDVYKMR